ncbi:hypothetical protein BGZ58_001666 [Dissophora ornata]|nr:hypothetical protein BGZ58_001666 [Dissophora ornata]
MEIHYSSEYRATLEAFRTCDITTHARALELNLLDAMEEDQGSLKDFGNDLPGLVDAVENARLDSVNYFAVLQLPRRQRQQELEKQSQQLQQEVQCINQHIQIF